MARFIVNHGGVIHSVPDEQFLLHLGQASIKPTDANPAGKPAREATRDEIVAYYTRQGLPVPEEYAAAPVAESKADEKKPAK